MNRNRTWFRAAMAAAALTLSVPTVFATDDVATDKAPNNAATVSVPDAVMIRVPIDQAGQEYTNAAELRVINGYGRYATGDLATLFNYGQPVTKDQILNQKTASKDYWYGWNNWYGNGWYYNYYYNYSPYYSYYNGYGNPYYYYYSYPSYYNYYGYGYYPYYGYRYYWYARY